MQRWSESTGRGRFLFLGLKILVGDSFLGVNILVEDQLRILALLGWTGLYRHRVVELLFGGGEECAPDGWVFDGLIYRLELHGMGEN